MKKESDTKRFDIPTSTVGTIVSTIGLLSYYVDNILAGRPSDTSGIRKVMTFMSDIERCLNITNRSQPWRKDSTRDALIIFAMSLTSLSSSWVIHILEDKPLHAEDVDTIADALPDMARVMKAWNASLVQPDEASDTPA